MMKRSILHGMQMKTYNRRTTVFELNHSFRQQIWFVEWNMASRCQYFQAVGDQQPDVPLYSQYKNRESPMNTLIKCTFLIRFSMLNNLIVYSHCLLCCYCLISRDFFCLMNIIRHYSSKQNILIKLHPPTFYHYSHNLLLFVLIHLFYDWIQITEKCVSHQNKIE